MIELEKKEDKSESALLSLANIPQIGYGYATDFGLGFAHNYALDISREVLGELPKEKVMQIHSDMMEIFSQWKKEHGCRATGLEPVRGLLGALKGLQTPLSEPERQEKIKTLQAWQCHSYATTPIGLFNQLSLEKYQPLEEYMKGKSWSHYHYIQAVLILASHNSEARYQTSDCIYEATKLALWHLQHKKGLIEMLMPDALAMLKARKKSKLVRQTKKKEREERIDAQVSAAYHELCKEGKPPTAIQKRIQRETGLNQTVISRSMARLKLATRKKNPNR